MLSIKISHWNTLIIKIWTIFSKLLKNIDNGCDFSKIENEIYFIATQILRLWNSIKTKKNHLNWFGCYSKRC